MPLNSQKRIVFKIIYDTINAIKNFYNKRFIIKEEAMHPLSICSMLDLSENDIFSILQDAEAFSTYQKDWRVVKSATIANLFFEPSTRTHYSFIAAQQQMGCTCANFKGEGSSLEKGESFYDTIKTFEALGYNALIIRHQEVAYYEKLKNLHIPIINAGDGCNQHPSQCLLDLLTIYQEFHTLKGIKVAIVGDIIHSRVFHSLYDVLKRLGSEIAISGPKELLPSQMVSKDIDDAIAWGDVIMMLRIQKERHETLMQMDAKTYLQTYGLSGERFQLLQDHAIIMHPAPVNRGFEMEDAFVECAKSRIFRQMQNGVYIRKALIKRALGYPYFSREVMK